MLKLLEIPSANRQRLIKLLEREANEHEFIQSVFLHEDFHRTTNCGAFTCNTLQEHMALMLRGWAGIEKASSHSGRRTLITDAIHNQGKSVNVAQKIAGHVSPSTTIIYEEPPKEEIEDALKKNPQVIARSISYVKCTAKYIRV